MSKRLGLSRYKGYAVGFIDCRNEDFLNGSARRHCP